ncbi:hypothetical protein ES707_11510 [subsurface metagenome]
MHRLLILLIPLALGLGQSFDTYFTGQTLRFDYHHSGTATEEHISLDQVRLEVPWPGSRGHLLDETNLGQYFIEVVDTTTGQVIYSRGFSSIYREWETTAEAKKGVWRSFHESQRFPEPRKPVRLILSKRGSDGGFHPIYTGEVDPVSRFVSRAPVTARGKVWTLFKNGPSATKVDLLILGDGYRKKDRRKFHKDVKRLAGVLFETEPYRSRKGDFNVRAIDLPAPESGISNPRAGVWRDSPLGLRFNALDSDRYVLTYANRTVREVAAQAPYDALIILFNDRKYGGGGIFNLYATASARSSQAPYLIVHEFGHSFAGLADEYYTSPVAYEDFTPPGVEPWEPNITALLEPQQLKWWHLLGTDTPVPTPWNQAAYDSASYAYQEKRRKLREHGASEETMEALFADVKAITKPMLEAEPYFGKVGAFEGAGYQAKGLYRPQVDCIMFTRNPDGFCRVCREAIERMIDLYAE